MKYVQNPEKFEAIQFTGGEKNATEVIEWLKGHNYRSARWVPNLETDNQEFIELRGVDTVPPGIWIVLGERSSLELFTTENFEKMYSPEEPTVTERNYDMLVRETTGGSSEHNVPVSAEPLADSDVGTFMAGIWMPRYFRGIGSNNEYFVGRDDGTLKSIEKSDIPSGHVVHPISWTRFMNLGGVPLEKHDAEKTEDPRKFQTVVARNGKLYTLREDGSVDDFEIFVPCKDEIVLGDPTPPPASHYENIETDGYILDRTKYNDETMAKVREAFHGWGDAARIESMIMDLHSAGILFRERI